ncbi:MAG: chromosome partitioning protein ParB [Candidatus Sumerlaeota bacterium]|nr:chromosome partitioning protein ParB [Candidatus Sumerlaeota bacterium]
MNTGFFATQAGRWRIAAPSLLVVGLAVVWLSILTTAKETAPFDPSLKAGARCLVAIEKLHPTQFCVGYWETQQRAKKISKDSPKKLKDYIEKHLPKIVIGPGATPYLIDGHHLAVILLKNDIATTVEVEVAANMRDLDKAEFWKQMKEQGWLYLYDGAGNGPLDPEKLPRTVRQLTDDPYRSLSWEVRERGGYEKTNVSFAEYKWAAFFRQRIKLEPEERNFEQAVQEALRLCHSPEAKDLPGFKP